MMVPTSRVVERMKQVTWPKAQKESSAWHTAVLEQCLLFRADTVRDRATVTAPSPASAPRPLPFRRPCPSQAPYLALPPSSPHLLPYHPSLSCSVPRDQNPGRVQLSCDRLGQRASAQAAGPSPFPLPQSSPKALMACSCPSALCLRFLASLWQPQHPTLPAPSGPAPREPPGTGQRAAPGIQPLPHCFVQVTSSVQVSCALMFDKEPYPRDRK